MNLLVLRLARLALLTLVSTTALGQRLHTAPIVILGKDLLPIVRFPLASYRLFRTMPDGKAEAIPFQFDEINEDSDYVLDQGSRVTAGSGNGIFDPQDELCFMGDDVGSLTPPTSWPQGRPHILYELRVKHPVANPMGPQAGAVYVGIFFGSAPPVSPKKYVVFNRLEASIHTSRYRYQFDQKNWLIARKVEVAKGSGPNPVFEPVLDTTTFYMKGDLKYFITVEANHRSIESTLEAWKSGPIRTIVRVAFSYNLLKLKLELGMYTEISFFSNAVNLPAMIYSPIDGRKSLNDGSGMYYGLALRDNPKNYQIETNMNSYDVESSAGKKILDSGKNLLDKLIGQSSQNPLNASSNYWISMQGNDRSIFFEIAPSIELRKAGLQPKFYRDDKSGDDLKARNNDKILPLGESPVNIGIWFDATKISDGDHIMGFRLFFENVVAPDRLAVFKTLNQWQYEVRRI